jgi:hypothetical protein
LKSHWVNRFFFARAIGSVLGQPLETTLTLSTDVPGR